MNRAGRSVGGQDRNDPLDLAPSAEMDDIAELAASVGPSRRLANRVDSEEIDQLRCLSEGRTIG